MFLLNFLFTGDPEPLCKAACDVNGDGGVPGDPTDAITFFNFNFNFQGGMEPPPP